MTFFSAALCSVGVAALACAAKRRAARLFFLKWARRRSKFVGAAAGSLKTLSPPPPSRRFRQLYGRYVSLSPRCRERGELDLEHENSLPNASNLDLDLEREDAHEYVAWLTCEEIHGA